MADSLVEDVEDMSLDLFTPPPVMRDIIDRQIVQYIPDEGETFAAYRTNMRINTKSLNDFLDMSQAWLDVTVSGAATFDASTPASVSIEVSADSFNAATPDNRCAAVNNGYALFSEARLRINDVELEQNANPAFTSYVKYLAEAESNGGSEAIENAAGLLPPNKRSVNPNADVDGGGTIENLLRSQRTGASDGTGALRLFMPLSGMFGSLSSWPVMRGMRYSLELTQETNRANYLVSDSTTDEGITAANTYISRIRMYVPIVKLSLAAVSRIEEELANKAKALRILSQYQHYEGPVLTNGTNSEQTFNVVSDENDIRKVYVFLKNSGDSFVSDRMRLGFGTGNNAGNLSQVIVRLNNEVLPRESESYNLSADAATTTAVINDAFTAYWRFLNATGKDPSIYRNDSVVDYLGWRDHCRVHAFDIPQHLVSAFSNASVNDLVVKTTLNGNFGESFRVHVVVVSDHHVMLRGVDNRVLITKGKQRINPPMA